MFEIKKFFVIETLKTKSDRFEQSVASNLLNMYYLKKR
jgi:hypothetical protein